MENKKIRSSGLLRVYTADIIETTDSSGHAITGYQPGIALSRSISLGPMETFLLTLSVGGIGPLRAWLAGREVVSRRPRRIRVIQKQG